MAKKVVASMKKADVKVMAKVIKMVRSPKTGAYTFKSTIMVNDEVKDFLAKK